jgi:hypothetical protein
VKINVKIPTRKDKEDNNKLQSIHPKERVTQNTLRPYNHGSNTKIPTIKAVERNYNW